MTTLDTLERLLRRPWSRVLVPDDGTIAARVPELPGCFAEGATLEEALGNLEDALASWLQAALETGTEIPEPQGEEERRDGASWKQSRERHYRRCYSKLKTGPGKLASDTKPHEQETA